MPLNAKTLERADSALQRLFPKSKIERKNTFLSEKEQQRLALILGEDAEQSLVTYYLVHTADGGTAYAYLDAHRVRTLPETVMISVTSEGEILSIDVLVFREPEDYIPRRAWYEQFHGRSLKNDLRLNREIQGVSGATLTAKATVRASRKMLSIHQVLMERDEESENKK